MDPAYFIFTAVGLGLLWWKHFRTVRPRVPPLDEAFMGAVHLAAHAAHARSQMVETLHLLYGLLHDAGFRKDAQRLGADVDAIERRIFADIDLTLRSASTPRDYSLKATEALENAARSALARGRSPRPVDLFASLLHVDSTTAAACAAGGLRALDLLFLLVHGTPEAELAVPGAPELGVVLINDDVSTMELVTEILEQDFAIEHAEAVDLMLRVHHGGRAEVGRYPAAEARAKVRAATERARARGYPLLLRLEAASGVD